MLDDTDPLLESALAPLHDLLRRYRSLADWAERAADAIEAVIEDRPAPSHSGPPGIARIEAQTGDVSTLLAFQERLASLDGVTRVTIAGSTGDRASFLVELEESDSAEAELPKMVCTVCGKTIREGGEPVSHGLCEDCRQEFGSQ